MKLTMRQGIARYQSDIYATPTFLRKSVPTGEFIDLIVSPDPTIIIFAHRAASYVVEESKTVPNAWGPFPVGGITKYLYWDVNLLDASLTRGYTSYPPIIAGIGPINPAVDQHWYDTTLHQMKVWNGVKWLDKLRVFAATYSSTAVIQPMPLGSQVGETGSFDAGNLVLDEFKKPLRQSDGSFVTSTTLLSVINSATQPVKFEAEIFSGMADEYIPMFSLVSAKTNRRIKLARSDDWKTRVIGIATEDLYQSEVGNVTTDGLVRREQWDWPEDKINRPVFCGPTGEPTLSPPTSGVSQVIGYVYDKDSIYVNIQQPIILDDIRNEALVSPTFVGIAPIADFNVSASVGTSPFIVTFTNASIHNPTTLEWDIGNNGSIDGTGASFNYTFTAAGTYAVRLRASSNYGMNDTVKTNLITVNAAPTTGTKTNLGIQLSGPLQVASTQVFSVSVIANNDGVKSATQVARVITVEDMGSTQVTIGALPLGATWTRVSNKTVITMPLLSSLSSGQYANASIPITAPNGTGTIKIRASVVSPETDSTLSDNTAELSIKVK